MGQQDGIGVSRLGYWSRGWDIGLEAEILASRKRIRPLILRGDGQRQTYIMVDPCIQQDIGILEPLLKKKKKRLAKTEDRETKAMKTGDENDT